VDTGKGITPHYVDPIVMTEPHEVAARQEACAALGLDPDDTHVLISLGGGSISEPDSIAYEAFGLLREFGGQLTPVQVVSPLAEAGECPPGLIRVSAYPVMRYARAFDAMITAAGYNSVQEAVSMRLPSILVPNVKTITDDQSRRAHLLAEQALCWVGGNASDLREAVRSLADEDQRHLMRERLEAVRQSTGASDAAAVIDEILRHSRWPGSATTLRGKYR